jgi:hypothetical protein
MQLLPHHDEVGAGGAQCGVQNCASIRAHTLNIPAILQQPVEGRHDSLDSLLQPQGE